VGAYAKTMILGIIGKISWALYMDKIELLNLFNELRIEKKLALDKKIEIFNKISQEIGNKFKITYEDIGKSMEHINDPEEIEAVIRNYFNKIEELVMENSNLMNTTMGSGTST